MLGDSCFKNIVEAVKAVRARKLSFTTDHMMEIPTGRDRLLVSMLHPTMKSDKDLVLEIMKLGVDLYKIEKNITD